MSSNVIYSIAAPFNDGGMSTIAWHACMGLKEKDKLALILAPETHRAGELKPWGRQLPLPFQKFFRLINRLGYQRFKDDFFDRWASSWMMEKCDYYGWLHQSLACIRKCHQMGGKTYLDRGSVEPRLQNQILKKKYQEYGLNFHPIHPLSVDRMVKEAEETDFIVATSQLVADSYMESGYPKSKIKINPLGVDLNRFNSLPEERESNTLNIGFIGQISIRKGIPELLKAWKKLSPKQGRLLLAGSIPPQEKSLILPMIKETPQVEWKGHENKVEIFLQECQALVLPSNEDGFGLVVLEAMAMGLPVLVSDHVGARDCIEYGTNGWVYCSHSQESLIAHLDWILKHRDELKLMRTAVLKTAENYSWEHYKTRFIGLFD